MYHYILNIYLKIQHTYCCEFISNGDIIINVEFDSPYDNIDKIIRESVNSVIDKIKEYILQLGIKLIILNQSKTQILK